MALVHGKSTVLTIDSNNVKAKTSDFEQTADSHDVTVYGDDGHTYAAGLTDGKFSCEGIYDNTASTGPRAVLQPLVGADPVAVVRQPDGTGSGKAQDSFSAQLTSYKETSPVNDMVTWAAQFQISGTVDITAQS